MPTEPRAIVENAARDLIRSLSGLGEAPALRVTDAEGQVACLILVWDARRLMPTVIRDRRRRDGSRRAGCKQAIVEAIRAAGRPLTRKQLVKMFRDSRAGHGPGTVAKALADLTGTGELINPKDKRGYRLSEWPKPARTPTLFD